MNAPVSAKELSLQLEGYSLATAEILYRMPDAQSLLQTFLWQDYDRAPEFPKLHKFLDFWERELDGPIHSVRLCHAGLIGPREFRYGQHELSVH
ncbi:MAG: aspartate-semialdehyde dehydrogenase [Pseudomonadota bacterium]